MLTITKDSEANLLETLNDLREFNKGYYAIHFYLAKLQNHNKSEFQIKIALNVVSDFFKKFEGKVFLCKDNDIIVIYKSDDKEILEKSIFQLRYLFADDPLAFSEGKVENYAFCSVYILTFQWKDFFLSCKKKITDTTSENIKAIKKPLSATNSQKFYDNDYLVNLLNKIDLNHTIRNQAVSALRDEGDFKPLYNEYYTSISMLKTLTNLDIDIYQNKLLLNQLTKTLDINVLKWLSSNINVNIAVPLSINLNIETVFSDSFLEFNTIIGEDSRSLVIIELDIVDIFNNFKHFLAAKDYLHDLGYRVCLDGLNFMAFLNVDREILGFDLIKLQWDLDLINIVGEKYHINFADKVVQTGSNRIILCHCDNEYAIKFGKSLNISLFQGWYIDKIIKDKQKNNYNEQLV